MTYSITKYRDGQVTAKVDGVGDLHVKIRGNTYEDLFSVASAKEAWDNADPLNKSRLAKLTIYCLIGQRSDRRFETGASFDLKVICRFINSMNFDQVEVFHPHSAISLALIDNSVPISHYSFVKKAYDELDSPILISPDAGAYKTTHEIAEKIGADLVPSNKVRVNGAPQIQIQGEVSNKDCLIVDDLADGGRTFSELGKALKIQGAAKVFLYVSHGQFNFGFDELKESIDHIYCTNSYQDINEDFVTQYTVMDR